MKTAVFALLLFLGILTITAPLHAESDTTKSDSSSAQGNSRKDSSSQGKEKSDVESGGKGSGSEPECK